MIATASSLAPTYPRSDLAFARGEGAWLFDASGCRYLDFLSGIAVNALGHGHPAIMGAIAEAARAPIHVSNLYAVPAAEKLAAALCRHSFADAVFFCNSGTEAVEGALKFARKMKPGGRVVAFKGAFHGRTMGALSVTWNEKYRAPFAPLVPGVEWADFNDLEAAVGDDVSAVIVEPIQGEGGVVPASAEFMQALRRKCDAVGAALICDEVQCGMGRTGRLWAHEASGVRPDVMTVAKPLGGGFPIGAILMREKVAAALQVGDHGSTFGGNPFICTVAHAVLETVAAPGFVERVAAVGERLQAGLLRLQERCPDRVHEVRGRGLMQGVVLSAALPVADLVARGRAAGVLLGSSAGNTLRLLPPLIVDETHVDFALEVLEKCL